MALAFCSPTIYLSEEPGCVSLLTSIGIDSFLLFSRVNEPHSLSLSSQGKNIFPSHLGDSSLNVLQFVISLLFAAQETKRNFV